MKKLFSFRSVIFLCGGLFIGLALEYLVSANFAPEWLTRDHPLPVAAKYYTAARPHLADNAVLVNCHIALGLALLTLGFLQLSERFRTRHRQWHRVLGVVYMTVGAVTAGLAIVLSSQVLGGLTTQLAMVVIALLWYFTAIKAIYYALRRQYKVHQRWVVRNFFVAVAPGLARPSMVIIDLLIPRRSAEALFPMAIWTGLLLSLLLSQWYVEKSQAPRLKKLASVPSPTGLGVAR